MTLHRDWALASASLFLILGLAAVNIVKNNKRPRYLFLSVTAIAGSMLLVTGFLGGEAVYRHGLGVMSLPTVESDSHHHDLSYDHQRNSAHQHDETTDEFEPHHLDELMTPSTNVDSDTKINEQSHDAEMEATTPHEHQH